ncbi:ABC transporter permease [Candidatus Marithrix sp. Canyon 246]|uniref:ABC transporter permease n=1 Tax=Candidatus Marithrix sp. Canyon 246 TaxID=1827136 RepID=UPI00084A18B0|nr:FtsX-like permease family protein [Candidatus Marithrix sp. Canyon 246]
MKLLIILAWRNLWRYPGRTSIIIIAITIGIWSMLSISALMRGIIEQQVNNAIQNFIGHIQIHAPNYHDDPVINYSMSPPQGNLLNLLNNSSEITNWATRVRVPAVVSSERETIGVSLLGIDPAQEQGLSFIGNQYMIDDHDIILGRKLADYLETRLGKRVVLMSQTEDNEIVERGFRVAGIYDAKTEDVEMQFVFIKRQTAQTMLEMGDKISELEILSSNREQLDGLLAKLRSLAPKLDVETWKTIAPILQVLMKINEGFLLIWYIVVFIAMAFGLINTLLMAIFERTREIGLLQALGMKPASIIGQILFESMFLLMIGLIIGNFIGWLTVMATADGLDFSQYAAGYEMIGLSSLIYPVLNLADIITANILIISLGLVASFYPAWRAAQIVPLNAVSR